jgi:hypothetical protein
MYLGFALELDLATRFGAQSSNHAHQLLMCYINTCYICYIVTLTSKKLLLRALAYRCRRKPRSALFLLLSGQMRDICCLMGSPAGLLHMLLSRLPRIICQYLRCSKRRKAGSKVDFTCKRKVSKDPRLLAYGMFTWKRAGAAGLQQQVLQEQTAVLDKAAVAK